MSRCQGPFCALEIDPERFALCHRHWPLVPPRVQALVAGAWGSDAWAEAVQLAASAVADHWIDNDGVVWTLHLACRQPGRTQLHVSRPEGDHRLFRIRYVEPPR